MGKNTTKYFLGLAILMIWGLLIFRITNKMRTNNDWQPTQQAITFNTDEGVLDSFALSLDYASPFNVSKVRSPQAIAVNNPVRRSIVNDSPLTSKANKKKVPKPIYFPTISYNGTINLKTGRKAALVKMNGDMMNMGEGETYEKVLLSKIFEDSIQLKFAQRDTVVLKAR